MLNLKILVLAVVVSLSFLGLVKVKVYVHDLNEEIISIEKAKTKLGDDVQVLKAEWSNLNRPERLKALSDQYLKLEHVNTKKIKYLGAENGKTEPKLIRVKNSVESGNIQWRYKPRELIIRSSKDR